MHARVVLEEGTPEEIGDVESGEAAVSAMAKKIRKRRPKGKSKKKGEGRNINAQLWKHLRDALDLT